MFTRSWFQEIIENETEWEMILNDMSTGRENCGYGYTIHKAVYMYFAVNMGQFPLFGKIKFSVIRSF